MKKGNEVKKHSNSPSSRGIAQFPASVSSRLSANRRASFLNEGKSPQSIIPPVNDEVRKFLEAQRRDNYSAYFKARMELRDSKSRKGSERPVSAKIGSVYSRAHRKSAKHKIERDFSAK